MPELSDVVIASSFNRKIDRLGGERSCWPWTGSCMTNGYGQTRIKLNGHWRSAGAHQVAYFLATGRWERKAEGRLVRHMCHNRKCCNPAHLLGGTAQDNANHRAARIASPAYLKKLPFLCLPVVGVAR